MRAALHAAAVLLLAGCPSAPDEPTWAEDVRPILAANCIRCHGYPAIGGAPAGFRLDVYEDTDADGRVIRGAGAMAEFIAARARDGSMPPRFPLDGYQRDVLDNWWSLAAGQPGVRPPRGPPADGNRPPAFALRRQLDQSIDAGNLVLQYEIRDPDRDLVHGSLALDTGGSEPVRVANGIHAGRGEAVFDLGRFRDGTYPVIVTLDDGSEVFETELGDLDIDHGSNAPPRIVVDRPRRDDLISDADGTIDVVISPSDLDAGDILTVDVAAVLGDFEDPILSGATLAPVETQIPWDTDGLAVSGSWRIRATITDGQSVRTAWSPPFFLTDGTTDETWDGGISTILSARCGNCHAGGARVPDLTLVVSNYDNVVENRGAIYRRVVQIADMPPPSGPLVDPPVEPMTDEERARLKSWLEAGAPR